MPKILVVDDKASVRSYIRPALEKASFSVVEAADYWSAREAITQHTPDLIILDIVFGDLPDPDGRNGLDLCKWLRENGSTVPVILCSRLNLEEWATRYGADDYYNKQHELQRLEKQKGITPTEFIGGKDILQILERVHARLPKRDSLHRVDDVLHIDLVRRYVRVQRDSIWHEETLAPKEKDILEVLLKTDGRPVPKQQLMAAADIDADQAFYMQIRRLREKIEPNPEDPKYIISHSKIGYSFRNYK